MAKVNIYPAGFMLLGQLEAGGLRTYPVGDAITIARGDAVIQDGAGYLGLAVDGLTVTFMGIAVADADNASGANGAIDCQVIPPLRQYQFIVPVEANALITVAAIGTLVDVESEDGIDINDTAMTANGFLIDEIDVSTEAIAANTYGYAIGHFASAT